MKKQIKTILGLTCAGLMAVSLAACKEGGTTTTPPGGDENPPAVQTKEPVVVGEAKGYYFAESPADIAFNMRLNGGTFQSLKMGDTVLTKNNEYKFNLGTEVLTLYSSYLSTLDAGEYNFKFVTDLGSCDVTITVGESGLTEGYNMQFAKSDNPLHDRFFAKASRSESAVKFDFLTFGDFTTEGTSLEFINLLIDKAPYDDTGLNWRLSAEDMNVRLYSDGTVLYRTFTGQEVKNGVANGLDNIWWRINRTTPNYLTEGVENVTISRENGVTKFTLELPYEFLDMESTDGIRFAVMECSDASSFDFNLYASGIVELDGKALGNPEKLSNWPLLTAEGEVVRPENIVVQGVPEGYDLSFARGGDRFFGKISLAENGGGVAFDFWTEGTFGTGANGGMEFVNIYIDMPNEGEWNKTGKNWALENEDINIRIYSDGTVYKKTGFNGSADVVWYPRTQLTDVNKLEQQATITQKGDATFVGFTIPFAELNGVTKDTFEGFRFYLAEGADSAANFDYFGADLSYKDVQFVGADCNLATWPLFDQTGNILRPEQIEGVPEGYGLVFAGDRDKIYSKISYAEETGVTFDFWTKGDFDKDGDTALEFVQIYLDMPAFNTPFSGNWKFNAEDIIIRVYSDGSVYFKTDFNGNTDNIWIKREAFGEAWKTIAIEKANGVTSFSLTVTLEDLGVTDGTIESFRFYLAECSDNSANDFNFYGSNLYYQNVAFGDAASCENFAVFTLATNEISHQ